MRSALEQQADDSNLDEYEYNVKAVAAISFAGEWHVDVITITS